MIVLTDMSTLYLIVVAGRKTPTLARLPTIFVDEARGAAPAVKSSVRSTSFEAGSRPGRYVSLHRHRVSVQSYEKR